MAMFLNFYRCERCGNKWADLWSAACDDDCPSCGLNMSPHNSQEVDEDADDNLTRLEDLILTLDSTFSDLEAAKRKGYLVRDLPLLHKEADAIRQRRAS